MTINQRGSASSAETRKLRAICVAVCLLAAAAFAMDAKLPDARATDIVKGTALAAALGALAYLAGVRVHRGWRNAVDRFFERIGREVKGPDIPTDSSR
ncbi:hypothetical protein ACFY7H_13155 [Streptomyces sp. NPDC012794]|uniref:hypothetical protein n=1 Tax=Streptomyces sp. NPDC012794 TaxID=3364850 RepID=UPI003687F4F0